VTLSFSCKRGLLACSGMTDPDYADLTLRLLIDLGALGILAWLIVVRRPRRGLIMVYATFNVGLFAVLNVISVRHVGPAVGFGLFAMLSIVRLRSEPFTNPELAYFFSALVIALVCGLRIDDVPFQLGLVAAVLLCLFFVDHPALYRRTVRHAVTLDVVHADPAALRAELERRLGVEIVAINVEEIDYVRETMRLVVRSEAGHAR
jgi:hypothetical protein